MKKILLLSATALFILSGCATYQMNNASVYEDDLYYNPSDKPLAIAESYSSLPAPEKEIRKQDNKTYSQLKSSYQQSAVAKEHEDLRDFSGIQQEYTQLLTDDSVEEVDTMLYYNEETGYWVNDYEGSEMDRDYAERLAKFHGPFVGIPYWSPLYNEVIFGSGFDYNVYVEGDYAIVVPEWYSPYYYNWRYRSPYNYYGWYGSFGWNYPYSSWGFGFGYSNWYSPYYNNWGYPYHHHHYAGYPYYGNYSNNINRVRSPREVYSDRVSNNRQVLPTTKSTRSSNSGDLGRTSRVAQSPSRTRTNTTSTGRTTRASYNRNAASTTKSAQTNRTTTTRSTTTRSTYTPTYTRPASSSSNTRSTYNRSSRSSSPANTSKSSSSNSRYTNTRSNRSTYSTGSARSNSSNYNRSSSGSSSRSYTPSYNSGSRSSSSSYSSGSRSSSGSSRSSSGSSRSSSGSSRSSSGSSRSGSRGR